MRITSQDSSFVPPGVTLVGLHRKSPREDWDLLRQHLNNPKYDISGCPAIAIDYETHPLKECYKEQILKDAEEEYQLKLKEFQDGIRSKAPSKMSSTERFPIDHQNQIIAGIGICTQPTHAFYINLAHRQDDECPPFFDQTYESRPKIKAFLERIFKAAPENSRYIAHNSVYEYRVSCAHGIDLFKGGDRYNPKLHCTMIMSRLRDYTKNGLKELVSEEFNFEQPHYDTFVLNATFRYRAKEYIESLPGAKSEEWSRMAAHLADRLTANVRNWKFDSDVFKDVVGRIVASTAAKTMNTRKGLNKILSDAANNIGAGNANLQETLYYAGQDPWWTLRLFLRLRKMLAPEGLWDYYLRIEAPILPLVAEMAEVGVKIRPESVLRLRKTCLDQIERLRKEIPEVALEEFKSRFPKLVDLAWSQPKSKVAVTLYAADCARELWPSNRDTLESPVMTFAESTACIEDVSKEMQKLDLTNVNDQKRLIWEFLGYPILKLTDGGAPSFDKEAAAQYESFSQTASLLIDLKRVMQTLSLYAYPYLRLIHPDTGRVHGSLRQSQADTGRFTASEPNFQQMSKQELRDIDKLLKLRTCIEADSPDHIILAPDFSQIELRLTAVYSCDETMMAAYRGDKDGVFKDIHRITCDGVFGDRYNHLPEGPEKEKIISQYRKISKSLNFLIVYGGGAETLKSNLMSNKVYDYTVEDCQEFIDQWNSVYPGVKQSAEDYINNEASLVGYGRTFYGRRRYLGGLAYKNARAVRQAVNHRIQGTAAEIIKITMARLFWHRELHDLGVKILLSIHDELVFSVPKKSLCKAIPIIESAFVDYRFSCPLETSMGGGKNFGELREMKLTPEGKLDYSQINDWLTALGAPAEFNLKERKILDFGDRDWVHTGAL